MTSNDPNGKLSHLFLQQRTDFRPNAQPQRRAKALALGEQAGQKTSRGPSGVLAGAVLTDVSKPRELQFPRFHPGSPAERRQIGPLTSPSPEAHEKL